MFAERHYQSLTHHLRQMLYGIRMYQGQLPNQLHNKLSETYYLNAMKKLEKKKRKLDESEEAYNKAKKKFYTEFERVRKTWKKDAMQLKRMLKKSTNGQDQLNDFGL